MSRMKACQGCLTTVAPSSTASLSEIWEFLASKGDAEHRSGAKMADGNLGYEIEVNDFPAR